MTLDPQLLEDLNHPTCETRLETIDRIAFLRDSGQWSSSPTRPWMNLHAHTFYSFNSEGWSPSRLVFEAYRIGLEVVGSVDFDVLDAMEEMLEAGDRMNIKTTVGLETRVFIPEYADRVLNSPGEPGIAYFMVTGCTHLPAEGSRAEATLSSLKRISQARNLEMLSRVNNHLREVQLDYETDVLPLTPAGNPTERHLVTAYDRKGREVFGSDRAGLAKFWAAAFGIDTPEVEAVLDNANAFQELLRGKLMKKGGPGYIDPDPASFPTLESMVDLGLAMDALPTYAYLDGTSQGESNMKELLDFMVSKGVQSLNIIPDRNWNLSDPAQKELKIAKLAEAVDAAEDLDFPIVVGTEMNKAGQPLVDNFDAPEMAPFVEDFRKGAHALWGHTLLSRTHRMGWSSRLGDQYFGQNRRRKLDFYQRIGSKAHPGKDALQKVRAFPVAPESLLRACGC
jgi:hypothetical protein